MLFTKRTELSGGPERRLYISCQLYNNGFVSSSCLEVLFVDRCRFCWKGWVVFSEGKRTRGWTAGWLLVAAHVGGYQSLFFWRFSFGHLFHIQGFVSFGKLLYPPSFM